MVGGYIAMGGPGRLARHALRVVLCAVAVLALARAAPALAAPTIESPANESWTKNRTPLLSGSTA